MRERRGRWGGEGGGREGGAQREASPGSIQSWENPSQLSQCSRERPQRGLPVQPRPLWPLGVQHHEENGCRAPRSSRALHFALGALLGSWLGRQAWLERLGEQICGQWVAVPARAARPGSWTSTLWWDRRSCGRQPTGLIPGSLPPELLRRLCHPHFCSLLLLMGSPPSRLPSQSPAESQQVGVTHLPLCRCFLLV